ncbi:Aste57867_7577 [Aphanomyces stellatus]|uniref:Aste57867_1609 protein n=1 Tax=Aphanomyces stellatus TaxID=120398 RepID=A0A485KIJ9_9STRA|nr:hypothetical protein As57867_007550 [Aphanomyces stellatus]KAF0718563.1 hypothetical protein As57867_001607 [Aphanomyces stellatus]VFT78822.1 Aste57867_1609 [Aphanomyces stellatus]VFT84485.1 Aste57867_7577 [Aphanomyces stellatus]
MPPRMSVIQWKKPFNDADLLLGVGLLGTNGAEHYQYRKILNPLFSASQVMTYLPIFEAQTRRCCDSILTQACEAKSPLDMLHVFQHRTLEIIGKAAFGYEFQDYPAAHAAYQAYTSPPSKLFRIGVIAIPGFLNLPLSEVLRRRGTQKILKKIMTEVIENKLQQLANVDQGTQSADLLDLVLPHSTTSEAIFGIAMLTQYPTVATKVRQEYIAATAKHGTLATGEALAKLKYTLAMIQETLRLNTIVYPIRRQPQTDDDLPLANGSTIFIPKGIKIQISIVAMHRNPKYWADTDSFIPDRFVENSVEWKADLALRDGKPHKFFYFPFGGGSKNGIGQHFAIAEMQLIVAMFAGQFDFHATPKANLRLKYNGITVQPAKVEVTLRRAAE